MDFFNSAVDVLQTLIIALGVELGIWSVINLMEDYSNDSPNANGEVLSYVVVLTVICSLPPCKYGA